MKVKVLSIKPAAEPNCHEVCLTIGENQQIFRFATKVNQVGERQIQTTQGDREFRSLFRFNQRVAMNVSQLVVKFCHKETVEFPADVGNFVTSEEALSKLKPFEGDRQPEFVDQRQKKAKISQQVRRDAILLVENLPESLLDEAVNFLSSLSVKANHPE
jgi:hypothetical protein